MTSQEQLAREWAETFKALEVNKECRAAVEFILANTKPPTMEDVEWDAREHRGLGTVGEDGTEWVMLHMMPNDWIACISSDLRKYRHLKPEWLTPNGKRYKIVEATVSQDEKVADDQPEHPKTLRTVEDYGNAPVGTIAAINGYDPIIKGNDGWGRTSEGENTSEETARLAVAERKILRWGWNW